MKERAPHECRCGAAYQRRTEDGTFYWCLFCDAHYSACAEKGSSRSPCPGCTAARET